MLFFSIKYIYIPHVSFVDGFLFTSVETAIQKYCIKYNSDLVKSKS